MTFYYSLNITNFNDIKIIFEKLKCHFNINFIEVEDASGNFQVSNNLIEINSSISEYRFHLDIGIIYIQNKNNSLPRIYGSELSKMQIEVLGQIIEFSIPETILSAEISTWSDALLQKNRNIFLWEALNLNLPKYVKKISPRNVTPYSLLSFPESIISIESLPGHFHIMGAGDKLWFGSCWQMYYAPIYYKYIPKTLWDDFNDCFENTVFENGLRRVTLFENAEDFDLESSRERQWSFRRRLGIDSIAHELTLDPDRVEPDYLPVLITKQDCKLGQTKVTRYLTKDHQLAMSEDLVEFMEVKEYLEDGITVVDEFMIPW